jgi:hypothetical protein
MGAQSVEAHKILAQTEVQCGLEKFRKIHEKVGMSLNEFFIYLPKIF